jgi:PAS domain S-box-containing protein
MFLLSIRIICAYKSYYFIIEKYYILLLQISKKRKTMQPKQVILYIEDDVDVRDATARVLRTCGAEVITAQDGEDGVAAFIRYRPDLIIADIGMPRLNGLDMARKIRTVDTDTPIIITSGYSDVEYFLNSIEIGVSQFLIKPIALNKLMETVKHFLEKGLALKELREQSNLLMEYKKAVDVSSIVSKTDTKGIITFVNDHFCDISGYDKEELVGRPHNIIRHPDMPSSAFKEMWETIQAKQVWNGVVKNRAKNGSAYHVKSTIIPILDSSGNILEYIGIRSDITEVETIRAKLGDDLKITAKNLEEAYQRSREYEHAIDESNILSRTDLKGIITYVNDKFCKVCGYSREELIGQNHNIVRHEDMPESLFKELWETIESCRVWKGVIKNKQKDGTEYWVDSVILPILDGEGKTVEYMAIRHDVSDIIELHQELEETQREVIYRMGEIGESRSKETGYHVKRVAEYSKLLALKAGICMEEAVLLSNASPMHDIGKVGIPDMILLKPGKLSEEEFEVIKTHSEVGYNILKGSERPLLKTAGIVAHQHHERFDGKGYPQGLKGEEIHIYARITAVADVFDALGSDRCYKKAWPLDKILAFFKEERGGQFDPTLVDLFLDNLDEFLQIRDSYID